MNNETPVTEQIGHTPDMCRVYDPYGGIGSILKMGILQKTRLRRTLYLTTQRGNYRLG